MTTRSRRGISSSQKLQKYRIVEDDDDGDEIGSKVVVEDNSNKFGGILASLNNKPPPKMKTRNDTQKNVSKPPKRTPNRKISEATDTSPHNTSPRLPSSIVVDKKLSNNISPLPVQAVKRRTASPKTSKTDVRTDNADARRKNVARKAKGCIQKSQPQKMESCDEDDHDATLYSESSKSSSDDSESERSTLKDDDSESSNDMTVDDKESTSESSQTYMEYDETIESHDHTKNGSKEALEDEDEELEVDDDESEVVNNEGGEYTSEEEFEFNDDEEFEPDEDVSEYDSSEENLSDFIVEETPPNKKGTQRKDKERKKMKPPEKRGDYYHRDDNEMDGTISAADQNSSVASAKMTPTASNCCIPSFSIELVAAQDSHPSLLSTEVSQAISDLDVSKSDPPFQSPSGIISKGDETEMEETPAKFTPTRKALDFGSPEPQMAIVVDDDDDDDLDDALVATIIEEDDVAGLTGEGKFKESRKENDTNHWEGPQIIEDRNNNRNDAGESPLIKEGTKIAESPKNYPETKSEEYEDVVTKVDSQPSEMTSSKKDSTCYGESTPTSIKQRTTSYYRQEGIVKKGKWTLGAQIGKGSFGDVYVGMNTHTGVLMAVKRFCMKNAVMKDIRTEVELLRSLNHKNIVRYYGAQMDKKNLHVFQEWVPGGSVQTLLSKFGPFSMEVIQSYLSQTLAGLSYLHRNDVMHRDIKGSNILVDDEGVVKLADFGASKKLANLEDNLLMSMTVRGTPYFMAPEVFEEKYSAKADIWGVGCVVYQMVTGRPPWKDRGFTNPISLFNHIKKTKGPPPMTHPDLSRFSLRQQTLWKLLEELVCRCFDHDPSGRPAAAQLQKDPFFLTIHDIEDEIEENYKGLFSPDCDSSLFSDIEDAHPSEQSLNREAHSSTTPSSPLLESISSPDLKLQRSKSVVQWKSSFLTPPRPKKTPQEKSPSPSKETARRTPKLCQREPLSPLPDSRGWPEWAREELKKRIGSQSSPIPDVGPSSSKELSHMMGSLALSEDSERFTPESDSQIDRLSQMGNSATSKLVGLNFLESFSDTFEI
ncbi:protein kinase family protein [Nitzschia inconspicua]|uniref:Protein kinase family protein n=1 Tax=Nitzschia inconspicua TaxID=303405 RepID=A0A9K3L080_9STRA|nr:protein kinase family protein [Nitzschia inconspicua]KAG7353090.1 protein kinase family protein [Nitzschia inconspicua]